MNYFETAERNNIQSQQDALLHRCSYRKLVASEESKNVEQNFFPSIRFHGDETKRGARLLPHLLLIKQKQSFSEPLLSLNGLRVTDDLPWECQMAPWRPRRFRNMFKRQGQDKIFQAVRACHRRKYKGKSKRTRLLLKNISNAFFANVSLENAMTVEKSS